MVAAYRHPPVRDSVPPRIRPQLVGDGVITARCCHCRGNVVAEDSDLTCLMCARGLQPRRARLLASGRLDVVEVEPLAPRRIRVSTAGHMAERRVARQLARDEGTSRAASIYALLPNWPEVISASKIARVLSLSKSETEQTLAELLAARRIRRATYDATYFYVGFYRR